MQAIDISSTKVSDLNPLKDLTNVQWLYIHKTQVSDLSPLKNLLNLQWLYIYQTSISDLNPLKNLLNLRHLDLYSTKISDLNPLGGLVNLRYLNISDTQVKDLSFLKNLIGLRQFWASSTQVWDLSPLKNLIDLKQLWLSSTNVSNLRPLKSLIENGPAVKLESTFYENGIYLENTPLSNPPIEIAQQGNEMILNYWRELEISPKTNNQLKIMFLGNGCVGKTTLLHWFLNKAFTEISLEEGRTHGIFIKPFAFPDSDVLAHFWDFGGQEVFHAMHRLFLGQRSLYVLVWATESPEPNDDLQHPPQYWLDMIADIADRHERSRVLVVQNQFEGQPERNILNDEQRADYEARGLDITTYCVNAMTGLRVKTLMTAIEEEAGSLLKTHVEELPATWVAIRQKVEGRRFSGEKTLSLTDFEAICQDYHLSTPSSVILNYFHRTGELFYYDNRFANHIILDQEWALKAVYAILKRKNIDRYKGKIQRQDLVEMWQADGLIESSEEAQIFLNFMLANKTAFYTEEKYREVENPELVIPQLLPSDKPEFYTLWEDLPNKVCHRIAYQFLHRDLIEGFIVQTAYLSNKKEYWRNGLFINYLGNKAVIEVVEIDKKPQIQIECVGATQTDLLQKIREEFNKIRSLEKAIEWQFKDGNWVIFEDSTKLKSSHQSGFTEQSFMLYSEKESNNLKTHLSNLIENGQLKDALDLMRQIGNTQSRFFQDPMIGFLSRYNRNERDKDDGIIASEDYRIERNRIESAVKSLLDFELDASKVPNDLWDIERLKQVKRL